ncbi:MAG: hypothetical protein U1E14_09550 [Geminicoccaceae bacterium]
MRAGRLAARGAWLLGAVLALTGGGSWSAMAASGEPFDTTGLFEVDNTTCQNLRTATSVDYGAILFACNADRSTTNGREPCDIYSLSTLVNGPAIGVCTDILPDISVVEFPEEGNLDSLETERTLSATSYGVNNGMTLLGEGNSGTTVDTVCTSFSPTVTTPGPTAQPGVRACRQVVKCGEGGCPATPPAACDDDGAGPAGEMLTTLPSLASPSTDVAALCAEVQARLAATITGSETPDLSHVLFLSATQEVGTSGSQALLVCPGYTWKCGYPATADKPDNASSLDYQIDFGVIQTPGCGFRRGRYICWK